MDMAYEKVCPICGNAAPLASKFCSGCGHEYRTVFHEHAEPVTNGVDIDSAAGKSGFLDSRWAPVLAVVPVLLVILLWRGNSTPQTPVTDGNVVAPVYRADNVESMGALVQVGQTEDTVLTNFGTPTSNENGPGGSATWYYVRAGHTLTIHFNGSQTVDSINKL